MNFKKIAVLFLLAAPGCGGEIEDSLLGTSEPIAFSSQDAALILDLANYPGTTLETLDLAAELDVRAAKEIISYRDGGDGLALTEDDNFFSDLAELQKLPYVASSALYKMRAYAMENPAPSPEAVEGIYFRGWEAESAVWAINFLSAKQLDVDAGLDAQAVENLVALRPFRTVTQIGAVAQVGPAFLETLRVQTPAIWHHKVSSQAGIYDGILFEDLTASVAFDIANKATYEDLVASGMWSTGAARLVDNRPYSNLSDAAAVTGIGTETMLDLRNYAESGTWYNAE